VPTIPKTGKDSTSGGRRPPGRAGRLERWLPVLVLCGAAGLLLSRLGGAGLYDLDESVYAEISREMLALRDWLTPHLDFIAYLEKPPLLFWLNSLAFKILGQSELSARLPTALAAVAGVGLVIAIGRSLWSPRAGLAAGAILATSFGYFVFGRMVLPDMLFTVLLTGTLGGFSRALTDEAAPRPVVLAAYAAMAGAVLTKGVIGLVFPALAIGLFLLATRDWRLLRRLELARGGALFLLLAAPWHILMARAHPGFLRFYFLNEHLARFLGHRQLQNFASLPVATYLAVTLVWFCPWSLFLPVALQRCWPRNLSDRAERGSLLVLIWAGSVVGFFVLSAVRLEYYALPALPALALVVGRFWDREVASPRDQVRSGGLTATWVGLIAFAVCLVPAACLFPRLGHLRFYNIFPDLAAPVPAGEEAIPPSVRIYEVPDFARLVPLFETVVGLIVVGTALSAWAWFRRRPGLALAGLALAMGAGLVTIEDGFRLYEPYRSIARLANVLRAEFRPGDQILVEGRYEQHAGLGFYTGQRVRVYRGLAGVLVYDANSQDPSGTFVSEEEFIRLWRGPARVYLLSAAPDGWARTRAVAPQTVLLGRTGNNWLFANRAR